MAIKGPPTLFNGKVNCCFNLWHKIIDFSNKYSVQARKKNVNQSENVTLTVDRVTGGQFGLIDKRKVI